ncbi:UDP-glucose 4-epimerase [Corynebacterium afermentans subsp. afermentans]|uniref:UDP-glucose 4-epimerase n=1 Tax=Corynebacterium afermentans TaxID=38286 RepID=A0A9X8R150_9CORY|nr:UDP-glucose 4-epimerase GalE [Corynebacterium afermentans]OAA17771.1 UDP-glucose 4-epimerase GalE [Corynebacterium afermentans subsp. afermentans]RUQ13996.1 UDP-glucose 4-epimerase GalE [Corynebacterium genitalium]WJY56918.1 UDP-glucose 4-epimerase [Corynebacterium afermentans subsp. afermentans]SIP99645.1 UDP-galactose 4-epimerase [Corynebacterium afermentans]
MKLVVTGGAGYVGSVCAAILLEAGHEVIVVDDLSTGNRYAVPKAATFVEGKIQDVIDDVLATDGGAPVDGVLHFAAKSLVGESMEDPAKYWHGNLDVSLALLDSMRRHDVKSLVFSSTAATYGEPDIVPIAEDAPTRPTNPYGATKLAIDYAITSYCNAYGLGATSLRYFNVAGAYEGIGENHITETHLIPIVLQVALGYRDKIMMYGDDWPTKDGTCVRDYIHIRDLADAHVLALEANSPGTHQIYNLGSGDGYSVREVVEVCREVTGHPIPAEVAPRRAGDPATLIASSEKIRKSLGWEPSRTDLRTIVEDAWEFTRQLGDRSHSAR